MNPGATAQPAGNYYDKYRTKNPIARALMNGFLRSFDALLAQTEGETALEIGCGEAELSIRMAKAGWSVRGCDLAPEAIAEAERRIAKAGVRIPVETCDIARAAERYPPADLVVCCEVLEHLEDPDAGLDVLATLSRRWVLVSVPREPIWRALNLARGSYWRQLGNTPGHLQHWRRRSFLEFLSRRLELQAVRTPLPWTMALGRVR